MRKHFLFLFLATIAVNSLHSQARGNRVGYIDMEYILENVTSYKESNTLLEQKAENWKQEIETKKIEINKVKEALTAEKPLLTKSLIEERESEITFLENELLDLQQKRFGPNGLLMSQKALLVKPIQDQVFTAVQDIAEAKKYDFIFDKSSDLTLLFADKRFDISDQVLRVINRTEKREQLSKKELAAEQEKENKEDAIDSNPELAQRQKVLDERKAARDKIIADRKLAQEQKKKEYEERRQQILDDRAAKKNGTISETAKTNNANTAKTEVQKVATDSQTEAELAKQKAADAKAKALEDRNKIIEDRKKALEERRQQILNDRAAKKTETVSETAKKTESVNTAKTEVQKVATPDTQAQAELAKQKAADAKAKTLEDRKKIIEDRKKELELRRLKIIQQRDSIKRAKEEKLKQ